MNPQRKRDTLRDSWLAGNDISENANLQDNAPMAVS